MATNAQKDKWAADVLALIDQGHHTIAAIIEKRHGASMAVYIGIRELIAHQQIYRAGNYLWRVGTIRPF